MTCVIIDKRRSGKTTTAYKWSKLTRNDKPVVVITNLECNKKQWQAFVLNDMRVLTSEAALAFVLNDVRVLTSEAALANLEAIIRHNCVVFEDDLHLVHFYDNPIVGQIFALCLSERMCFLFQRQSQIPSWLQALFTNRNVLTSLEEHSVTQTLNLLKLVQMALEWSYCSSLYCAEFAEPNSTLCFWCA